MTSRWLRRVRASRALQHVHWKPPRRVGVILLYHRVARLGVDPNLLSVNPNHFTEHMEVVEEGFEALTLKAMVDRARTGSISGPAVAITFDDGYREDLFTSKSLLQKKGIPATAFVTTGVLREDREFWHDQLEKILLEPGRLPETLELGLHGRRYTWRLGPYAEYSREDFKLHRGWNLLSRKDPTPRHRTYRDLCKLLYPLPPGQRDELVQRLLAWSGTDPKVRPAYAHLGSKDIVGLTVGDTIDVGSHTVSHPILSRIPLSQQRQEIHESKDSLEEVLGRSVDAFSYPYGSWSDYDDRTVSLLEEAGFSYACSNIQGVVTNKVRPHELPRFVVRDWGREEFERNLEGWFRG